MVVQSTSDGDDQLVIAHLHEHQKIRNMQRDPRVAATIVSTDRSGPHTLSVDYGTARVEEGGAPELLTELTSGSAEDEWQLRGQFSERNVLGVGGTTPSGADPQRVRVGERRGKRRAGDLLQHLS
jgi:hypothetical protein